MPEPAEHKRLKLATSRIFAEWCERASDADREAVLEALFKICEGAWREHYEWRDDVIRPDTHHVFVTPSLVLSWRVTVDHPTFLQILAIGPPKAF